MSLKAWNSINVALYNNKLGFKYGTVYYTTVYTTV